MLQVTTNCPPACECAHITVYQHMYIEGSTATAVMLELFRFIHVSLSYGVLCNTVVPL